MKLRVLTWTPSRVEKYSECPLKVKLEDLMKLCPKCFKGRLSGGFDGVPVTCDTCDLPQKDRPALERGTRLDAALTTHLSGAGRSRMVEAGEETKTDHREALEEATRHPAIRALAEKLRNTVKKVLQASIVLDRAWQPVSQYTKGAWARMKLDVLVLRPKVAEVIDWKSGGIDKRTGGLRDRPGDLDAMLAYQMGVLSAYPQAEATATMAYLDAPPKLPDPFKRLPPLKRKDLEKEQKRWEEKVAPMFADEDFAPRPGFYCAWCDYAKGKGGPCPY